MKLRALLLLALPVLLAAARNMEVYFIDVEGGQSTLIVSPGGESLLIDAGYAGNNHRDALRIAAAAKNAGVKKIDYLVTTHFHADHAGGIAQLSENLPIRTFVDHGALFQHSQDLDILYRQYSDFRDKGTHILAKPGDKLPVKGLDVTFVASDGVDLTAPLAGAGKPNPDCASFEKHDPDVTENSHSIGMILTYGSFRMADLGDLTWDKEYGLVCPNNLLGPVDFYLMSHHGGANSGSPQLVHALGPRVALMNNGARKGGAPETWQITRDTPGVEDIWQLHYAVAADKGHNSADPFIANIDEKCEGAWIKLTVKPDGSFTVYNSRNKYEKAYARR